MKINCPVGCYLRKPKLDIELENKYFDKLMEKERQAGVIACFFNGDLR